MITSSLNNQAQVTAFLIKPTRVPTKKKECNRLHVSTRWPNYTPTFDTIKWKNEAMRSEFGITEGRVFNIYVGCNKIEKWKRTTQVVSNTCYFPHSSSFVLERVPMALAAGRSNGRDCQYLHEIDECPKIGIPFSPLALLHPSPLDLHHHHEKEEGEEDDDY